VRFDIQAFTQWFASYRRRVGIEFVFGDLKDNVLHVRRGHCRVFGLTAHQLLLEFTFAAQNLVTLRDWHLKRGILNSWGKRLGEPKPEPLNTKSRRRGSH